ncbi:MAG: ABC transporter permease [Clostridia bacterium]
MILLTLIKKEIKEFFRNKSDVIVMLIFPVILIFVMGKSLDNLMSVEKNIFNNKTIYYRINAPINNEKNLQIFYDFMINFEKKTNVKFIENKNYKEAINDVNNNKAICFMDIYDNKINYFRNEKKESTESKIFRNLYEQYMRKYSFLQTMSKSNLNQMTNLSNYQMKILLKDENINEEEINSYTYYTFAELILIILYISTLTSISMYKERFLHTMTRLKVSNTNRFNILASKIALGIIIGLMQTLVVYIVSTKLLNVNWGDNLTYIMLVLISFIIFSSVLGIFISIIFHNQKTAYTVNNILIIIMGLLGGSYVPICLVKSSKITSFLCNIMPNYWANIALLGLHYNMETKYYIISILISLSLSLIMLIVGNFISKQRVGGNFD